MYGHPPGPHGPGHHGHGPGHHGPHGHHDPHGPRHHGPHGYYGPHSYYGSRSSYSLTKKDNKIDYMKTLEYAGSGQKYYNSCACSCCSKPFEVDYRLGKNVTFVSESQIGFRNGIYYSDQKFNGYFKFEITCPECNKKTLFFVETKKLPKYVLDQYFKETCSVMYTINYSFDNFNAYIDVLYETHHTNIKDVYKKINSLYLEKVITRDVSVSANLDTINKIVLDAYNQATHSDAKIHTETIKSDNSVNDINKLKIFKYMLLNNGIRELLDYKYKSLDSKEEIKILSR